MMMMIKCKLRNGRPASVECCASASLMQEVHGNSNRVTTDALNFRAVIIRV